MSLGKIRVMSLHFDPVSRSDCGPDQLFPLKAHEAVVGGQGAIPSESAARTLGWLFPALSISYRPLIFFLFPRYNSATTLSGLDAETKKNAIETQHQHYVWKKSPYSVHKMPVIKPAAGSGERPQQYKQPSRKGKRAWRKNIDISDVTTGLEELNKQIIAG